MDTLLLRCGASNCVTAVALLATPPKFKRSVHSILLVGVLVAAYFSFYRETTNFYDVFNLSIKATAGDIHKAWAAEQQFFRHQANLYGVREEDEAWLVHCRKAYNTLSSADKRSKYAMWGDYADGNVSEEGMLTIVLLGLGTHLLCLSVGFLFTFPKSLINARQVMLLYGVVVFCLELQWRFAGDEGLPFAQELLPYEKNALLKRMFSFVNCVAMIGSSWMYVDASHVVQYLFVGAAQTTNRIAAIADAILLARKQERGGVATAASSTALESTNEVAEGTSASVDCHPTAPESQRAMKRPSSPSSSPLPSPVCGASAAHRLLVLAHKAVHGEEGNNSSNTNWNSVIFFSCVVITYLYTN